MDKKILVIILCILVVFSLVGIGGLTYLLLQERDSREALEQRLSILEQTTQRAQDEELEEEEVEPETNSFSKEGWDITFEMEDDWVINDSEAEDNEERFELEFAEITKYGKDNLPEENASAYVSRVYLSKESNPEELAYSEYCARFAGEPTLDTQECDRSIDLSDEYGYEVYEVERFGEGDPITYVILWNNNVYKVEVMYTIAFLQEDPDVLEVYDQLYEMETSAIKKILSSMELLD